MSVALNYKQANGYLNHFDPELESNLEELSVLALTYHGFTGIHSRTSLSTGLTKYCLGLKK